MLWLHLALATTKSAGLLLRLAVGKTLSRWPSGQAHARTETRYRDKISPTCIFPPTTAGPLRTWPTVGAFQFYYSRDTFNVAKVSKGKPKPLAISMPSRQVACRSSRVRKPPLWVPIPTAWTCPHRLSKMSRRVLR